MDDTTSLPAVRQAPEYRLYFLDGKGHIRRALDLACRDDAQAISVAAGHADGHAMELWERDRHVKDFSAGAAIARPRPR